MPILPAGLGLAFRRWRHRPGLAVTATLVLALGIGATAAMYSIVDAVILRDEPWPDANRLVRVFSVSPQDRTNPAYATRWNRGGISWWSWRDLQKLPVLTDIAIWEPGQYVIGDDRTDFTRTFIASSSLLALLGVTPERGRFFTAAEDDDDSKTVVISHRLWVRVFGADPDIVGKQTMVTWPGDSVSDYSRRTIIGVLPETMVFPGDSPEAFLPLGSINRGNKPEVPGAAPSSPTAIGYFSGLAKLAPHVSIAAAAAAAEPLIRRDEARERRTSRLVTLRDERVGVGDGPLWFMFAGAALLLVVACSNVAGLLLSDARSRHHETAVRLSLGGSRVAILRGLFLEHAVLAAAAGGSGVLLAAWLIPSLISLAPPGLVGNRTVGLNAGITGWSIVAAVVTTFVAGLVPAAAISSTMPGDVLKSGGREATTGSRWRHRLVVAAQFGLALVLIVGAGLFGETVLRIGQQPLGFSPDGVVMAAVAPARPPAAPQRLSADDRARLTDLRGAARSAAQAQSGMASLASMLDRLGALPGVTDVAMASAVPFVTAPVQAAYRPAPTVYLDGQRPDDAQQARVTLVSEAYFRVMGMPILRGRSFEFRDTSAGPFSTIVVSTEFERRLFGGTGVGRRVHLDKFTTMTVVGVVADAKIRSLTDEPHADFYALIYAPDAVRYILVRPPSDPGPFVPALRGAIEQGDSPMFVTATAELGDLVSSSMVVERGRAMLSAMYGGVALLLAAVGLYGLATRFVAEHRREIGIRIALGAGPDDVQRLVMADAWFIVGIGLAIGTPVAFIISKLAQGMLFGVTPAAPHVLGLAAASLALVAVLSTVLPARRANRIDAAVALRQE